MQPIEQNFETIATFMKALKVWRGNGKSWLAYRGQVCGKLVELKTYGHTYLQIFRVDSANKTLPPMDCKVGQFNAAILKGLE